MLAIENLEDVKLEEKMRKIIEKHASEITTNILNDIFQSEDVIKAFVRSMIKEVITNQQVLFKEWFTLKEAAKYAGVSQNTFTKFRDLGLKVTVVEGINRVSRKEIDRFLNSYSN